MAVFYFPTGERAPEFEQDLRATGVDGVLTCRCPACDGTGTFRFDDPRTGEQRAVPCDECKTSGIRYVCGYLALIVWRWRVKQVPGSPWAKKRGGWTELRWHMTPAEAEAYAKNPDNYVTAMERVEGSDEVRVPVKAWGCPAGRGGTV